MKHKHAEIITAWAYGEKIEFYNTDDDCWMEYMPRSFHSDEEYRIKQEIEHVVIETANISLDNNGNIKASNFRPHNVRFAFNGKTGEIKSVEVM